MFFDKIGNFSNIIFNVIIVGFGFVDLVWLYINRGTNWLMVHLSASSFVLLFVKFSSHIIYWVAL